MLSCEEFYSLFQRASEANKTLAAPALFTEPVIRRFYDLTAHLLQVNSVMNLTAITDPLEIIVKHYLDCAAAVSMIPDGAALADIGTGAGFPALPFAILRPDITITAVDSTQKKLDYVAKTAELLGLENLTILCSRAELLGQDALYREHFDMVSARAVARLNVLAEWCLPLVKKGGYFLAMKGRGAKEELSEAENAINILGGVPEETKLFSLCLPEEQNLPAQAENADAMQRGLLLIKKRQFTPKQYPRPNTRISKKPL